MANKPINRFEVQIVFDRGGYWRETSRRDKPLTRLEVAEYLEEIAARIRRFEKELEAVRGERT
jgi:hypothetical protein